MSTIPCLETLVTLDNSGQAHPALATAWKLADDSKSITLTLRQGVKFHDGSDFNAIVAKWNIDRYLASSLGPRQHLERRGCSRSLHSPRQLKILHQCGNDVIGQQPLH